jgi:hypothetical protein
MMPATAAGTARDRNATGIVVIIAAIASTIDGTMRGYGTVGTEGLTSVKSIASTLSGCGDAEAKLGSSWIYQ